MKTLTKKQTLGFGNSESQSESDQFNENNTGPWRGVFFDGPTSGGESEEGEIPLWHVYVGDEDAEPVQECFTLCTFESAENLARRMAAHRRIELIHEATPA